MYPVVFNRREICQLTIEEFQNLKSIVHFWGLSWEEQSGEFVGRFINISLRVIGLDRRESIRLNQLLTHTGINITTEKFENNPTLSVFHIDSYKHLLTIETAGKTISFNPNNGPFRNTKEWVYKGISVPEFSDEVKVYMKLGEKSKMEWICYVILQMFNNNSPNDISSIPVEKYKSLLQIVLTPINPSFASYQLNAEWPTSPPHYKTKQHEQTETINPFKHKHASQSTRFDPFKPRKNHKDTRVINPFFKNKTP
ncbi:hypothetical protein [Alkalihalobacillus sp. AL-G]|uniref:hypothetical protein n=1 Tax=Alkalihalobacillus sp. AL-G TaxID=2926399 RepID=UPI00272DC3B3|nr:hypothetical protein [Alkalihalobacillus sp. AL-G]WLD94962.1 hypothetical protein MOJ78_08800 [Alkalihalobacillus sp. AL-G]